MPVYITPSSGTTSGVDIYPITTDIVIRRAMRMVGAFASNDSPRQEQQRDAVQVLNMMLKSWATEGHLWCRQMVTVDLVAGDNDYQLGPDGTPVMDRPVHVINVNRKSSAGNEIPMVQLNRADWFAIPNKTAIAAPVQFYYDPTTTNGTLYVWPVPPTGTTDKLVIDCDRQLDVQADNLNEFDFPPQWADAIVYNLAARLAPEYGLSLAERVQLNKEAELCLLRVATDDRDMGSVFFGVRR